MRQRGSNVNFVISTTQRKVNTTGMPTGTIIVKPKNPKQTVLLNLGHTALTVTVTSECTILVRLATLEDSLQCTNLQYSGDLKSDHFKSGFF